jgi:hypothetical protein
MRSITVALLLLLCVACEPPCEDSCADVPPAEGIVGDPSDFTIGPQDRNGIAVSAPYACGYSHDGHAVFVKTQGELEFPESFVSDVVVDRFTAEGIEATGWGFGLCGDEAARWVAIDDWTRADDAVRVIGNSLHEYGYSGTIELRVQEVVIYCAQVACAF